MAWSIRKPFAVGALTALAGIAAAAPGQAQFNYAGSSVFGKNKIAYRQFDWKIYHSTHFDVYYYTAEEQLLQKVVSFAESAYDRLSQEFDFQIQDPTPLIFYRTHSAFQQNNTLTVGFIPEGVQAFAVPVLNRMVLPVDLPDPELMALITHELTHIFQFHILFGGRLGKGVVANPPTWVTEGMASYMAKDEDAADRMYLRDAVVNDFIPPITQTGGGGFFAYRYGHAAFDYIEERWGEEGFRDFVFEYRNTITSNPGRAIERAFGVPPADFDADFRRWLRRKYLPELVAGGEPGDFGRPFRVEGPFQGIELSPVSSPSGDLVAAFSSLRGDVDVVLLDAKRRTLLRNLTKGHEHKYEHLIVQMGTIGRRMGRDLAFSPDGNRIAAFAKREAGRSLVLLKVLKGGIDRIIDMPDVEQQHALTWSPDGRYIAFSGNQDGQFDIFLFDTQTEEVRNLTQDKIYDSAPSFSPDGTSLVISSVVGQWAKLFRVDVNNPSQRYQLTFGESDDTDAVYSPSGERIYFTSDRDGRLNIYGLDVSSQQVNKYTDAATGCLTPTVLPRAEAEQLVYTARWKGSFTLYRTDVDEPVGEPEATDVATEPIPLAELPRFEPDIQVSIDEGNKGDYKGRKFFLEDINYVVGIDDDQTFVGQVLVSLSDFLGDRRIFALVSSVESFRNFQVVYVDRSRRWQWSLRAFDDEDFFLFFDPEGRIDRERIFQLAGVDGSFIWPFNTFLRASVGAGYRLREFFNPVPLIDPATGGVLRDPDGNVLFGAEIVDDDFPLVSAAIVGDNVIFSPFAGPISGRRFRIDGFWAPDVDSEGDSSAQVTQVSLDYRQYVALGLRTLLAWRVFAGQSGGNVPNLFIFGGLDTLRGFEFNELVGTTAFFSNIELRIPFVDVLSFPGGFRLQNIRGRIFLDVGGAWFDEFEGFRFWNGDEDRLQDGVAAYGWGFSVRLFGLDLNWDFAKQWDFDQTLSDSFVTTFYIGSRF